MFWDPFRFPGFPRPARGLARRGFLERPAGSGPRWHESPLPAANVRSDEERILVTALVPGLSAEDLDLSVDGEIFTLAGEFHPDLAEENGEARSRERAAGRFSRSFRLPYPVDRDGIEAGLERGVLRVELPRAEENRPHQIEITSR